LDDDKFWEERHETVRFPSDMVAIMSKEWIFHACFSVTLIRLNP
jgi:predicted Co/Zn/Cd cation transporter (cation efflux family)